MGVTDFLRSVDDLCVSFVNRVKASKSNQFFGMSKLYIYSGKCGKNPTTVTKNTVQTRKCSLSTAVTLKIRPRSTSSQFFAMSLITVLCYVPYNISMQIW